MIGLRSQASIGDRWRVLSVLLTCCLVAFFLRVYFSYDLVFLPRLVRFAENDPWYHVRAVEYLVANFPHRLTWDPYALQPGGQYVGIAPLLDYFIASIALILGAGNPSLELTHRVCAWFPAVLGSLIPIPVYVVGKSLHDRQAGLFAAATMAVLPGPFLARSFLGYTDHHVVESFLILLCGFLIIRLLQASYSVQTTNKVIASNEPRARRKQHLHAIFVGIVFGLYLLSWVGGSVLVLIIFVALVVHLLVEHARGRHVHAVCLGIAIAWVIAMLMVIPFRDAPGFSYHITALGGSALFLICTAEWAWTLRNQRNRRIYFPIGLPFLAVAGLSLLRLAAPDIFASAVHGAAAFIAGGAGGIVIEAKPLYEGDAFTPWPIYGMFQTAAVAAALGTPLLGVRILRDAAPGAMFFLVWTLAIIWATLVQERFGYYLAAPVALLAGIFWSQTFQFVSRRLSGSTIGMRRAVLGAIVLLFVAIGLYPSAAQSYAMAHRQSFLHPDWRGAMTWLRQHTPEPFTNPQFFRGPYPNTWNIDPSSRPSANHGIMCWWDHGYWITEMGRRVPTSNPTQAGIAAAAGFFAAKNEEDAAAIMERVQARYVVVDASLPMAYSPETGELVGTLETIARFHGRSVNELYELYWEPQENGVYKPVILFYPEYFQIMLNRLYLFGGEEFQPEWGTWLVHYSTGTMKDGSHIKRIDQSLQFRTYEQAVEFQSRQGGDSWRMVSFSPHESCIPLEPLRRLERIYQSPTTPDFATNKKTGYVEIFKFIPSSE